MSKNTINNEKNKFRGVLSSESISGYKPNKRYSESSNIRSSVKSAYLRARSTLSHKQFIPYLLWCETQLKNSTLLFSKIVGYDELRGVYVDAPVVSLSTELLWISSMLHVERDKINEYLKSKKKIESSFFTGRVSEAIELQNEQFNTHGASIFGVQLRMALEIQAGGVDKQKQYSLKVRGIYKTGLLGYISFYASTRNESQSNVRNYLSLVKSRILSHKKYSDDVKNYLRFQLTLDEDFSNSGLADILRVEQSHSIIDVYETFVRICKILILSEMDDELKKSLENSILNCDGIEDHRIKNLLASIGRLPMHGLEYDYGNIGNRLIKGDISGVVSEFYKKLNSGAVIGPWEFIYCGIAYSISGFDRYHSKKKINIPLKLAYVISSCSNTTDSSDKLIKELFNLRGVSALDGIMSFINILANQFRFNKIDFKLVCIDNPFVGVESVNFYNLSNMQNSELAYFWSSLYEYDIPEGALANVNNDAEVFSSIGFSARGKYEKAIETLNDLKFLEKQIPVILNSIRIRFLVEGGFRKEVIEFLSKECISNDSRVDFVSIEYSLSDFGHNEFRNFKDLSSLIVLHLKWSFSKSEEDASNLRINIRRGLIDLGIKVPSEIELIMDDFSKEKLVYFLYYVCKSEFIDQIKYINSTIELLEERQNICHLLRKIDPINEEKYETEIAAIDYKRRLEDGEWIVDRTRIHVDSEALARWCEENIAEDYLRYRSLVDLETTAEDGMSDYLKDLLTGTVVDDPNAFSIETEADQLLITMIVDVREQFLKNPSFGLDFHLSKRIRHQSFIGLIRGPLENLELITTKKSDGGEYHSNRIFLKLFDRLDHKNREIIDKAFKVFSRNFDDKLTEAKDSHFQIYSQRQYPKGIIKLNLTSTQLRLVKELERSSKSFRDFIELIETVLWGALEPSLQESRSFISDNLNHSLRKYFDELKGQVTPRVDMDSDAYISFAKCLSEGYSGVSQMLENACGWFTRLSPSYSFYKFQLEEMIDIAMVSSMRAYATLNPIITKEISDKDTYMDPANTVLIHDVIFVAFGNIYRHSGLTEPEIYVASSVDVQNEIIKISVKNNVKAGIRKSSENRLRDVTNKILNRNYGDRTRKENRSGLIKLAAVAHQNQKGDVVAKFIDDENFLMEVTLHLIIKTS